MYQIASTGFYALISFLAQGGFAREANVPYPWIVEDQIRHVTCSIVQDDQFLMGVVLGLEVEDGLWDEAPPTGRGHGT